MYDFPLTLTSLATLLKGTLTIGTEFDPKIMKYSIIYRLEFKDKYGNMMAISVRNTIQEDDPYFYEALKYFERRSYSTIKETLIHQGYVDEKIFA